MCSASASPPDRAVDEASTAAEWARFVTSQASGIAESADVQTELRAASEGCVVSDLGAGYAWIEATGPDAAAFLHAQLSSDVAALGPQRAQLSTYSSPKGRVLATLLLWRFPDGFVLQVPASIAASLVRRLGMFVLRSKVRLTVSERWVVLGLTGTGAAQALTAASAELPESDFALVPATAGRAPQTHEALLRLPGSRYQWIFADAARASELWQRMRSAGVRAGIGAAWRRATIRSGIAEVVAETQDQFVLQMLNYELLGSVSFTKGCYPGQEIVARTQYRGEIKRRTLLLHARIGSAPAPGAPVYALSSPEQPIGTVLGAAAAPGDGFDLLACVHLDLAAGGELRLNAIDGPLLERLELPYALPGVD
jgi:folate-binding protein YgfZ